MLTSSQVPAMKLLFEKLTSPDLNQLFLFEHFITYLKTKCMKKEVFLAIAAVAILATSSVAQKSMFHVVM